jgi:cytidylate kinase
LSAIQIKFVANPDLGFANHLNSENVEKKLNFRSFSIPSQVAEISEVRSKLVEQQQEMEKIKLVMDGRYRHGCFKDAELRYL